MTILQLIAALTFDGLPMIKQRRLYSSFSSASMEIAKKQEKNAACLILLFSSVEVVLSSTTGRKAKSAGQAEHSHKEQEL